MSALLNAGKINTEVLFFLTADMINSAVSWCVF